MLSNHQFYIRTIPDFIKEQNKEGWRFKILLNTSTKIMNNYQVIFGIADENTIPHPIHDHPEEELIIIISGSLDLILNNDEWPESQKPVRLPTGSMVYLPSNDPHTFRAAGPDQTQILVITWKGVHSKTLEGQLQRSIFDITIESSISCNEQKETSRVPLFSGSTKFAMSLSTHNILIQPGFGYGGHIHPYDLIMVLLTGHLDTMFMNISSPALLLFPSGTTHWARNTSQVPASALTLELSGGPDR